MSVNLSEIFNISEIEPQTNLLGYKNNLILGYENTQYYEERLVPEEEEYIDNVLLMYYQYIINILLIYYQDTPLELTVISSDRGERFIKVESIIYSPDLLEHPSTLENGVAYIVNVENMSKEQIDIICENVSRFNQILLMYS